MEEKPLGKIGSEYTRRRCRICGSFYMTAGTYIEVGLCEACAKANGLYAPPKMI